MTPAQIRAAAILECVRRLDDFGERATVRHIRNALLSLRERPVKS